MIRCASGRSCRRVTRGRRPARAAGPLLVPGTGCPTCPGGGCDHWDLYDLADLADLAGLRSPHGLRGLHGPGRLRGLDRLHRLDRLHGLRAPDGGPGTSSTVLDGIRWASAGTGGIPRAASSWDGGGWSGSTPG